jgi:hypothetical protein
MRGRRQNSRYALSGPKPACSTSRSSSGTKVTRAGIVAGGCTCGSFRVGAPGSAQYWEVLTAPVARWWRCWTVLLVGGAVPVGVRGELGEIVIPTADLGGPRAERSANFFRAAFGRGSGVSIGTPSRSLS